MTAVDRTLLVHAVLGTSPSPDNPAIQTHAGLGRWDGSHDVWRWDRRALEHLPSQLLMAIYEMCSTPLSESAPRLFIGGPKNGEWSGILNGRSVLVPTPDGPTKFAEYRQGDFAVNGVVEPCFVLKGLSPDELKTALQRLLVDNVQRGWVEQRPS